MAWDDTSRDDMVIRGARDDVRDMDAYRDLMGAGSDDLFADPLGVRKKPVQQQQAPAKKEQARPQPVGTDPRIRGPNQWNLEDTSASRRAGSAQELPRAEDEESSWLGGVIWSVLSGGKQCCSMRDRTRDSHEAQRAGKTGRPPSSGTGGFPEPQKPAQAGKERSTDYPSDEEEQLDFGRRDPPKALAPRPAAQAPDAPDPAWARAKAQSEAADRERQRQMEEERRREERDRELAREAELRRQELEKKKPPPAAAAGKPQSFEWPPWCLNFKTPCIEVWVEDEDTPGGGRWVKGDPQSRVVDKAGKDAYLCVEYDWDGEFYVQDFGPEHVRRLGQKATVRQLFEGLSKDRGAEADPFYKKEGGKRDNGSGVSAFLNDE